MSEKPDWRSALKAVVEEKRRELGPHPGRDRLAAYHTGELNDEEAKAVRDHLVLCPECAGELLELEAFAVDAAGADSKMAVTGGASSIWRLRWPAAAAAAAAVLILVLIWLPGERLPDYDPPIFRDSLGQMRDAGAQEAVTFATGDQFRLILRPRMSFDGLPTARAYLRQGNEIRALSASTLEVSSRGVVTLDAVVQKDYPLPVGESELIVSVSRPWAVPSRDRLRRRLAMEDSAEGWFWNAFKTRIHVVERNSTVASEPGENPPVTFAGCREITVGPVCILGADRLLRLMVRHPDESEIWIDAGGWSRSHQARRMADGWSYEIEVAASAREVVVEVRGERRRLIWMLEVAHTPEPDWQSRVRQLRAEGKSGEARALIESRISAADPGISGPALGLLARIERQDRPKLSESYFRGAMQAYRKAGRVSAQLRDANLFLHGFINGRRFADARELLVSLPIAATGGSAEYRHYLAYYRSLLAEETGDLRTALRSSLLAARWAEKAGLVAERFYADQIHARQLATAGMEREANDFYVRMQRDWARMCELPESPLDACDCAYNDVNRAWVGLLAREAGIEVADGNPRGLLKKSEQIFLGKESLRGTICAQVDELPNIRLNLALEALQRGNSAEALRYLRLARVNPEADPRLALWQLDIEARIDLKEGRPAQALERYAELAERAEMGSSPEAAWRASFGRAKALDRLGRVGESLEACTQSERLLRGESLLVPMFSRAGFIAQREESLRFCLALFLNAGRRSEAMDLIRRSATRALIDLRLAARLANLEAEDRRRLDRAAQIRSEIEGLAARIWKGAPGDEEERLREDIERKRRERRQLLDELAALGGRGDNALRHDLKPPEKDVLLLAYHPLPDGWVAIARDQFGVAVRRVEALPSVNHLEEISASLLEPFQDRIADAGEIRIIPYGPLRDVDFHALAFRGGLLLDHKPVLYHLDLPEATAESPPPRTALILVGPGALEAPVEGEAVRRALESKADSWDVMLLQAAQVTVSDVRRLLDDVELFHYAGHAQYDEETRGWNSHLALSRGYRLTVDDILAAPRVPRWVGLSGCETGRDSRTSPLPSIGLAQAFLVAGAEAVVAAAAPVSDADAAELMQGLYRRWGASKPIAVALKEAQRELRGRRPESDWSRFRILVR